MVVIVLPLPERFITLEAPSNVIVPTASDLISRFVAALTDIVVPDCIDVLPTLKVVRFVCAIIPTLSSDEIE